MKFGEVKRDCKFFKGHVPCKFNKSEGAMCATCTHYEPIQTRILIIKLAALGDVIRTTPLLPMFRANYPNTHITWMTQSPEILPKEEIDQILPYNAMSVFLLENSIFDVAVNLDKEPEACVLMAKVESRFKFGYTWEDHAVAPCTPAAEHKLMTGFFDQLSMQNTKSYLQEIFEICHTSFQFEPYSIQLNQSKYAEWQKELDSRREGKRVVGLNTGCGPRWNTRLWADENWISLAKEIKAMGFFPMFLGGALEHDKNSNLSTQAACYYPGHFDLESFISLSNTCDVVITQVTMMMHIATALKKKMILMNTIFNPHEFELYGRGVIVGPPERCQCYFGNECKLGTSCMQSISCEMVIAGLKSIG
jgi:ADP-heptose:LPS heptosyltransferase